jgi:hypothetical protein
MNDHDDILDDLFHGAALAAFVEESRLAGSAPCPIKTRHRANQLYEVFLGEKNNLRTKK